MATNDDNSPSRIRPAKPDLDERRRGDRRRNARDVRFWRALRTERRQNDRRGPLENAQNTEHSNAVAIDSTAKATYLPLQPSDNDAPVSESSSADSATDHSNIVRKTASHPGSPTDGLTAPGNHTERSHEDAPAVSETSSTRPDLTDQAARRDRLRSMLSAADQRQARNIARRLRRPVMAAGLRVRVVSGSHAQQTGVVTDADYINSRAFVALDDKDLSIWFDFRDLAAAADPESVTPSE